MIDKSIFEKIYEKSGKYFYFKPYGEYKIQRFNLESGTGYYPLPFDKWGEILQKTAWIDTGWKVSDLESFKLVIKL